MKTEKEIRAFREQCKVFYMIFRTERPRYLYNVERYAAMITALDYVLEDITEHDTK